MIVSSYSGFNCYPAVTAGNVHIRVEQFRIKLAFRTTADWIWIIDVAGSFSVNIH